VTGEEVSAQELGGSMTHNSISGVAQFRAANEDECFAQIRQLLSYLPQNNMEKAERYGSDADPNAMQESLNSLIPDDPRTPYDMKDLIYSLADNGDFMEVQPYYAQNMIVGFLRLNGESIGVIANQPRVLAGCLDITASDKASRFIRMCDAFNVPLLTLVDVPGFLPGTEQEYGGIIRHGAKMLYAYSEATVPKVTLITRKAYGGAYIGMCSKHLGGDIVLGWPNAEIAVMGADGAANIIFASEIRAADDPEAKRQEKIDEYSESMMNPYVAAARGYLDDVILPEETRQRLISSFDTLRGKRSSVPAKKHGNIPL
jgi:acetyl-CoA carboxylase carboxyltransferase component